jgi:hypothetical protein
MKYFLQKKSIAAILKHPHFAFGNKAPALIKVRLRYTLFEKRQKE